LIRENLEGRISGGAEPHDEAAACILGIVSRKSDGSRRQVMDKRISTGQGIAIAGVWVAVAAVAIASLPFAVLIVPLVVPAVAVGGGVVVTRLILGRNQAEAREVSDAAPWTHRDDG
jgi:hypothetical protein